MSCVLLLQVDPETSALLRRSMPGSLDAEFEELSQPDQLLRRLRPDPAQADAIVLGAHLQMPVQVVQRVHALDRDLAILVLAEPQRQQQVAQSLQFAPYVGDNVFCRSLAEGETLGTALHDAVITTHRRRRYRAVTAAASTRMAELTPPPHPVQYLDRLLKYAPIGIVGVDGTGRVFTWNPKAAEILECDEQKALGARLVDMFAPQQQRTLLDLLDNIDAAQPPVPQVIQRRRGDGREQFIEVTVAALEQSVDKPEALVLFEDVTARVNAERERAAALQLRNELLAREQAARAEAEEAQQRVAFLAEASTLLAGSIDYQERLQRLARLVVPFLADWCVVDIVDQDGQISRVAVATALPEKNALLQELRRYSPTRDSQQLPARALRDGAPVLIKNFTPALLAGTARDSNHLRILHELDPRSTISVPLTARDYTIGVITLVMSESGRRYDERDLALAEELARRAAIAVDNARLYAEAQQALRIRDQFLSIAAHELKTPITALVGYSQLLQRRAERRGVGNPRDDRALHALGEQAHRLHRLISSLLDLSRIQRGQFTIEHAMVNLNQLIRRTADEIQATSERHTFKLKIPDEELILEGDELRLEQVLLNLLHNAIKYSPEGGLITLEARRTRGEICIAVSDQGVGIPADALANLFSRFYRAGNVNQQQIPGMGLGLYVVKEIVTLHGGTITVESEEGQGSTFTIHLPLNSTEVTQR